MGEMVPFPGDAVVSQYPKIYSPFKRVTEGPNKNKLREGDWYDSAFDTLQDATWRWTEKLDGTNIRVHWDGVRVSMAGRTDRAQLPMDLVLFVQENLPEELFEQKFQSTPVTLFGEGLGAGIQKGGGNYSPTKKFVLFDVRIGNVWMQDETISETAAAFGIERAKLYRKDNVWSAITAVENGLVSAYATTENPFYAEGLVGVPVDGFLNYRGGRIAMKIKHCDFFEAGVVTE